MEDTPKNIKIHFARIDYCIEMRKNLRKNLLNATEAERLEIIKNFALYNYFLLKFNRNFVFSNLIYLNMFKDSNFKSKIKPKLYNIISERFITEDELQELISSNALKVYPSLDIEPQDSILRKFDLTDSDVIHYLKEKEKFYLEKGDLDGAMAARSLVKEYSPPGLLTLNDLFTDRFLAKYSIHPLRYDKFINQFSLLKIKNFLKHNSFFNLSDFFCSLELGNNYPIGLIEELDQFIFDNLGLKYSIELAIQYAPLINNLLLIASSIYFESLSIEDKIKLINKDLTIDMFMNHIKQEEIGKNYNNLIHTAIIFIKNGAPEFSFKIMKIIEQNLMDSIEKEDKFQFYEILATNYRELEIYDEALYYYKLAWEYVEYSKPYMTIYSIENFLEAKEKRYELLYSLECRKGVC
ncbi:MAG: hypothetical protein ACTSVK_16920, partial [Promethearchaeota archaeon]